MSIESQHERFLRDIRSGRARAADLAERYTPFIAGADCPDHPLHDHIHCPDCAPHIRARKEADQVARFVDDLWREQRQHDEDATRNARL